MDGKFNLTLKSREDICMKRELLLIKNLTFQLAEAIEWDAEFFVQDRPFLPVEVTTQPYSMDLRYQNDERRVSAIKALEDLL